MIILGITGSIATGKSTIVQQLKEQAIPVHEADAVVHGLLLNDQQVIEEISLVYPESLKNDKIDREKLASIVFSDQEQLKKLEGIVHPRVYEIQEAFLCSHQTLRTPLVVLEVPLLYEKGYDKICDYVIVMTCSHETQTQRALVRRGMTEKRLEAIRLTQMLDQEKINRADYVLDSDEPKEQVYQKLNGILDEIQSKQ